jgi:ubiquitin carboxyl-terminal hydrolase 8
MDLSKYVGKGLTGLENLGNTCFLNSCLQVINHTYELNALLDSEKCKNNIKTNICDSSMLKEWNDLRKVMWSGNGVVTPKKFVYNVQQIAIEKKKDIFTGCAQNDMPEFLLFFMDCLHNSISRKVNMKISGNIQNSVDNMALQCYNMLKITYANEYSEIMELFYGLYVSEIISKDGLNTHVLKPESYFILDLPILDYDKLANDLYDCFDMFIKPDILEEDNAWYNEKTDLKEDVKKQISFWNFPKILIITLKRFSPDGTQKINSLINFPLENLDLSRYVRGYNANSYVYDLFGICNHVGGVMGGHYTAFAKHTDKKWVHYNDRNVDIIENPEQMITPMAYCLFYRKKNNLV